MWRRAVFLFQPPKQRRPAAQRPTSRTGPICGPGEVPGRVRPDGVDLKLCCQIVRCPRCIPLALRIHLRGSFELLHQLRDKGQRSRPERRYDRPVHRIPAFPYYHFGSLKRTSERVRVDYERDASNENIPPLATLRF